MKIETTFAPGLDLAFTPTAPRPIRPPAVFSIGDDPILIGKYDALFFALEPGQCIVCEPAEVHSVRGALKAWIKRQGLPCKIFAMAKYPTDAFGRIWMLPA